MSHTHADSDVERGDLEWRLAERDFYRWIYLGLRKSNAPVHVRIVQIYIVAGIVGQHKRKHRILHEVVEGTTGQLIQMHQISVEKLLFPLIEENHSLEVRYEPIAPPLRHSRSDVLRVRGQTAQIHFQQTMGEFIASLNNVLLAKHFSEHSPPHCRNKANTFVRRREISPRQHRAVDSADDRLRQCHCTATRVRLAPIAQCPFDSCVSCRWIRSE